MLNSLGCVIQEVGFQVAKNLDSYIKSKLDAYEDGTLERILRNSTKVTGRLLHYFPVTEGVDMSKMKWSGWHNDHGTLSGLCSGMYLDKDFNEVSPDEVEDEESGLFAMNRNKEKVKIRIPKDALAIQIGESAQIHSGGKILKA